MLMMLKNTELITAECAGCGIVQLEKLKSAMDLEEKQHFKWLLLSGMLMLGAGMLFWGTGQTELLDFL